MALPLCLVLSFSLSDGPSRFIRGAALPPTALPNANVTPAGTLRAGVLALALEAKPTMWYPEGSTRPGREVAAFAEASKAPLVPGPLIRVSAGTTVRLSIRNTFEETYDFELTPTVKGLLRLEVRGGGNLLARVPVRVE